VALQRLPALRVELDVADVRARRELDHVGEPGASTDELEILRQHQEEFAVRPLDDFVHRLCVRAVADHGLVDEVEALDVLMEAGLD